MPKALIPRCFSWAPSPFAIASVAEHALTPDAGHPVHRGIKDAHADVRHADLINIRETKSEAQIAAAEQADGFVFGSPVYYAHPSGRILSALDRAFYAGGKAFEHKPGAAVAVARRGGTSTTFDVLNKYFTIKQMPVVASTYWNNVFGRVPGDADGDAEGLATMRNIGKNMAWLLRCIEAGRAAGIEAPEADHAKTNFIR